MVDPIALPVGLQPLAGRLVDVDSHEMMAAQTWVDFFGPEVKELADAVIAHSLPWETDNNSHNAPNYAGDVMAITDQLMSVKGPMAPGANDLTRRLDVMGAMGVQKQLMYPTGLGGWSMFLMMVDKYDPGCLSSVRTDRGAKAAKWLKRYNEWFLTTTKLSEDQLFYAMQRGLGQEDAVALLVNGFVREVLQELPMEFAVEAQKLIAVSLEGSVG